MPNDCEPDILDSDCDSDVPTTPALKEFWFVP